MNRTGKLVMRGAALLLAGGLLLGCGGEASPDELMSRAQQYLDKGDYAAATIELKNAVAADVGNAQARFLLGRTYLEMGQLESAVKELDRARELGMAGEAVLPLLAEALLALGKHDELMALDAEGLPASAQATVLAAQAVSAMGKRSFDEAGRLIDRALDADPNPVFVRFSQARLLFANGQIDAGRKKLDELLVDEPKYAPGWSFLGDYERATGHPDEAETAFGKALDVDASRVEDRIKRALIRIEQQRLDAAGEDLAILKKQAPRHPDVRFVEGMLYLRQDKLDEARAALEDAAERGGNRLALFNLASIHARQGNREQAQSYVTQYLAVYPNSMMGRTLAAHLALTERNYKRVEDMLRPVLAADPDDLRALNLLSTALLADGKTDEGLDLLSRLAALQPESAAAQARLAAGLLASGQGDASTEHLQKALELDPDYQQADALLVLGQLAKKDIPGAIRAAEEYARRHPDSATPYNLLGRIHTATGKPEEARKAWERALEIAPGDPGASQSLAAQAVEAKDYAAARRYYDGVLEKHPDYLPVQMRLAALDFTEGKPEAMVARLKEVMAAHPGELEPRLALVRHELGQGHPDAALALLDDIDQAGREQPAVIGLMAAAYLAQQNFAAAEPLLQNLVRVLPNVADHHYQLALVYARSEANRQRALDELRKTIELDPKHGPARVLLARALLAGKDNAGFEEQVLALREIQPDHPDVLLLDAVLARMKGQPAEALRKLEKAYATVQTPATVQALAAELLRGGDATGGRKLLEDWLAKYPDDLGARMMLADDDVAHNRPDSAAAQYRKILEADPQNAIVLNNLAWTLRKSDSKQALVHAQQASELEPERAEILDTLAVVLLENKRAQDAQQVIRRALKAAPDAPGVRYHAALVNVALGDRQSAIVILKPLVSGAVEFAEKDEARELLERLEK